MSDPLDLARRAVASAGWWWLPRMVGEHPDGSRWTVLEVSPGSAPHLWHTDTGEGLAPFGIFYGSLTPGWCAEAWRDVVPDLTDPATLGCIAFGLLELDHLPDLAALVAALEAAP